MLEWFDMSKVEHKLMLIGIVIPTITSIGVMFYQNRISKQKYAIRYSRRINSALIKNINSNELNFLYKEKVLKNPYLLSINILNCGNLTIKDLRLKVSTKEISIIPYRLEFSQLSYEKDDLYEITKINDNICCINFAFLNERDYIDITFFLDDEPKEMPNVTCTTPGVKMITGKTNNNLDFKKILGHNNVFYMLFLVIFITNILTLFLILLK